MSATPLRAVRVPDELWYAARAEAELEGVTVSDVVRDALAAYVAARRKPRNRRKPR